MSSPHTLTIYLQGFLLVPVNRTNKTSQAIVFPRVSGSLAHHASLRWIDGVPPIEAPTMEKSGELKLDRSLVTVGTASPASFDDQGIVPHFESLCCGAQFEPKWMNAGKGYDDDEVDVLFQPGGGCLVAECDCYTSSYEWQWNGCDGSKVVTRVTSLVRYTVSFTDTIVVSVQPLKKSGPSQVLTLAESAVLQLFYAPADGADPKSVDDKHIDATRELCDPDGDGKKKYGEPVPSPSMPVPPFVERSQAVRAAIDQVCARFKGRPNCGARQMSTF